MHNVMDKRSSGIVEKSKQQQKVVLRSCIASELSMKIATPTNLKNISYHTF